MTEPARARRGFWATLMRWRAPIILVPLLVGLCYAGAVGAQLLWGDPEPDQVTAPDVTCWDGSQDAAAECPTPTGLPGLRWTFPSFKPNAQKCKPVTYDGDPSTVPLEYSCRSRIEGRRAEIRYTERSSLDRGLSYLAKRYSDVDEVPTAAGTRITYRDTEPRKNGTYEVTVAYRAFPFSVTVTAPNERLRDTVLRERVSFRPERTMKVRPAPPADD